MENKRHSDKQIDNAIMYYEFWAIVNFNYQSDAEREYLRDNLDQLMENDNA